ncbi:TPA: PerC family transcriptional regulator [Citrobacter freundii]|uniref:MarR family transcriptional regulator n=1 Tax=Citrobacter freundii TaxID=546 RepID=UPI0019061B75|nr:MarR family transcriptional regulator [Citrobacter freundii]EJM7591530.1 PerC family transcriptional regulator [Citrobacter freundii]EKW0741341.1 PerC family transcriptional regulator [Citrobacter freundii]ELP5233447.1 PerC family transcriptional regulator [Citrobacter freundii]MBJ9037339.1 PerC family transcriptional regulator [Citrobacter freundii]MCH9321753.1 PerC family transcriptional regulator [Citrobacter freundii]
MTNYRVTQKEMVIAAINHMPGCTLRDICEALELTTSNAGKLLRRLTKEGIIVKSHEDRDPGYRVKPGSRVPKIILPFMLKEESPPETIQLETLAKSLEDKGLWRRAATVYIDILAQVKNSKDVLRIAEKRNRCVERSRGMN